ncbi:MAG TPA: helix-turn-helix transcriptional regulator [Polyangiaceae bacterium]|nr:helix-turn-helix transcriptional regulator [Polyangiaceae bacterium]
MNTPTGGTRLELRLTTPGQVADILRQRRKVKQLSQAEIASKLGVSQARISSIESKPASLTVERLIALANLLDLEIVVRDRPRKKPVAAW